MRGVLGWSIWFILRFICSGFRWKSSAISECSFVELLHSFLSLASRPICLNPAREIGGLSSAGVGVFVLLLALLAISWWL